ncbi:MAG TPA: hypothetical protein VI278_12385 [Nitrososphaeraceae archaeon]
MVEKAEDSAWLTTTDIDQVSEELHYLKQFDQATNEYRDIRWMYFRREVLNKYRNNDLCEIGSEYIKFLRHDKKTVASSVNFVNRNFANIKDGIVLMLQAQEYINVPPSERLHWNQYEIPESQIQF